MKKMKLEYEILINKYGQEIIDNKSILTLFESFEFEDQKDFLKEILFLVIQSKPQQEDIDSAIIDSELKHTFTPCIILKKGISNSNLEKLINLPQNEFKKVVTLLLSLFKIAYKRGFIIEKNNPHKWWYWDLSVADNVNKVLNAQIKIH